MHNTNFQRTDALQQALLEVPAHAHGLTGGFHLGAKSVVGIGEFVEGEPGHFGDNIVKGRLKGGAGVCQRDFVQRHAHADFGGDPGNRVAAGFGRQGGAAGDSGIDFNQIILEGVGVQRELHIAAALDFQRPNQLQRGIPEHMVLFIGQGLRRADDYGVTGVNAHRVQILHVADGDGGVIGIAHDFVLDFLIALNALFHKNLMNRGEDKGIFHDFPELFFIARETAAGAAQGKGGPKNHRVSDFLCRLDTLFHGIGNQGRKHRFGEALTQLLEQLTVLRLLNTEAGGAKKFRVTLLQNALLFQLHGKVQTGLAADSGNDGVGPFIPYDPGDILQCQRLHIDLVRDSGVRHDGGGVGIAQNHLIAFLFQGQAGLGAGVVKFCRLTNYDRAGTNYQNFMNICTFRHVWLPPSWQ